MQVGIRAVGAVAKLPRPVEAPTECGRGGRLGACVVLTHRDVSKRRATKAGCLHSVW